MSNLEFGNGHPRPRGARSAFLTEPTPLYPLQFGTVIGFDGTPIFYCTEGEGPPLVFCYGFACSALHWTYQIDYFRKNFKCIWLDYRGHRKTPIPEKIETLTIESIVKDVQSVLDFLDIKEAVFLGHSMGVSVVLEYAHQFPHQVLGLVLANGTSKRPLETLFGGNRFAPAFQFFINMEKTMPAMIEEIWNVRGKAQVFSLLFGAVGFNRSMSHPDDIHAYAQQIAKFPPLVMTAMMEDYEKFDATPWLHQIKMPTLVISGDRDYITPPETQELIHQLIPQSEFMTVRNGSHCSTIDFPELINLRIEKFLNSILS